jgi:hypothetical protein
MEQTIVEKHSVVDLSAALNEEIAHLRKVVLTHNLSSKLNWKKFDPTKSESCFLGQLFGDGDEIKESKKYRAEVGDIPSEEWDCNMTPLEIWSANKWEQGDKQVVKKVFKYIKGRNQPVVKW